MSRYVERLEAWWPLWLAALLIFSGALGAGFQWGGQEAEPRIRLFRGPAGTDGAPVADLAGFVTEASGDGLTVRSGDRPVQLTVPAEAVLQGLAPIDVGQVAVGDWVVVGGRDDNVNTFIVDAVVIVPPDQAIPPAGATP